MTKTPKKKSTYKETLINFIESAKMDGLSEEEATSVAKAKVQRLIDMGRVGDPKNRKTQKWKFEGTDMTITPSRGYIPTKSSKRGANNVLTPEIQATSELLKSLIDNCFDKVMNLHGEGVFSKLDLSRYEEEINKTSQHMIFNFIESNTKKS